MIPEYNKIENNAKIRIREKVIYFSMTKFLRGFVLCLGVYVLIHKDAIPQPKYLLRENFVGVLVLKTKKILASMFLLIFLQVLTKWYLRRPAFLLIV